MKVAEYRDLVRALLRTATDWHACTSSSERDTWAVQAACVYAELDQATCTRATTRDVEMCELARQQYRDLVSDPSQQITRPTGAATTTSSTVQRRPSTGASRAAGYNKSPARAVRLSRAARSAMRRGYF